jgi:hypothetical protein
LYYKANRAIFAYKNAVRKFWFLKNLRPKKSEEAEMMDEAVDKKDLVEGVTAEFREGLQKQQSPEEKVRFILDFMRQCVSQEKRPNFKHFWEAKPLCIAAFKEEISPYLRESLWLEYLELTSEAKRLKQILDEQSIFNEEQIKLALDALEGDLKNAQALIEQLPKCEIPETLGWDVGFYQATEAEVNLLNTFAVKATELRKELLAMEMRGKKRVEFLDKVKQFGDQVFPRRKELSQVLSGRFESDIKAYIEREFPKDRKPTKLFYVLKSEIKALQNLAKQLFLTSTVFAATRLALSE